jgi:hypothetical protein
LTLKNRRDVKTGGLFVFSLEVASQEQGPKESGDPPDEEVEVYPIAAKRALIRSPLRPLR